MLQDGATAPGCAGGPLSGQEPARSPEDWDHRWIKETYRRWPGRGSLAPLDLVAHLKPEARSASFGDVHRDLLGLLQGLAGRRERETRMGTQR